MFDEDSIVTEDALQDAVASTSSPHAALQNGSPSMSSFDYTDSHAMAAMMHGLGNQNDVIPPLPESPFLGKHKPSEGQSHVEAGAPTSQSFVTSNALRASLDRAMDSLSLDGSLNKASAHAGVPESASSWRPGGASLLASPVSDIFKDDASMLQEDLETSPFIQKLMQDKQQLQEQREAAELELQQQVRARAKADLEAFYAEHSQRIQHRLSENRAIEAAFQRQKQVLQAALKAPPLNPVFGKYNWKSIHQDLDDINATKPSSVAHAGSTKFVEDTIRSAALSS